MLPTTFDYDCDGPKCDGVDGGPSELEAVPEGVFGRPEPVLVKFAVPGTGDAGGDPASAGTNPEVGP
jgi:hypothetical protein